VGQFKFGHPHPEHSNSGLLSLIAEVYAAIDRTDGLTVKDIKSQAVQDSVGAVEQRVYHYGKKDTDLLLRMTQRGPEYLHAVTSYESNVIKWNRDHSSELAFPLVAIYPEDGTFWAGNPYCILDADWVSDEQARPLPSFATTCCHPSNRPRPWIGVCACRPIGCASRSDRPGAWRGAGDHDGHRA